MAYEQAVTAISEAISENLGKTAGDDIQDQSVRTGLRLAGWNPTTASMDAIESWLFGKSTPMNGCRARGLQNTSQYFLTSRDRLAQPVST